MKGVFHPHVDNNEVSLYKILMEKPNSQESMLICSSSNYFKTLQPTYWRTIVKEYPILFRTILGNPELAVWVNQGSNKGLLMIALYSKEHLAIASDHADDNIFSKEDREAIQKAMRTTSFQLTGHLE